MLLIIMKHLKDSDKSGKVHLKTWYIRRTKAIIGPGNLLTLSSCAMWPFIYSLFFPFATS
jgi:hypothetical protein